jgi:alpha-glucosidase
MYAGPQAIFRHWLRPPYSIDGWRIDVANMLARQGADQLGPEVAHGIRHAVKEENPAAYLMGENFFDACAQLQGDCWDGVMNYAGFTMPVWHWLGRFEVHQHGQPAHVASEVPWPAQAVADTWQAFRAAIPWVVARQQFNLISSHDTARIHSGDAGRTRLAVGLLMTYVGTPNVYYGDEVGLSNTNTHARSCMPWDRTEWDEDMRAFYQRLIALRKSSPALVDGGFQVLLAGGDTLAYLRDAEQEQLVIVGQRGPGVRPAGPLPVAHGAIPNGAEFVELFSGMRTIVVNGCLPLPAMSAGVAIWQHCTK